MNFCTHDFRMGVYIYLINNLSFCTNHLNISLFHLASVYVLSSSLPYAMEDDLTFKILLFINSILCKLCSAATIQENCCSLTRDGDYLFCQARRHG